MRRALALTRKALDQWLDAPDDQIARPLFVFGCQRSGTTMLLRVLARSPEVWVHPEKSQLAYDRFRLREPAWVGAVTRLTPAAVAVYKPLCDSHLADRVLALHPDARALWVWRDWRDVANSAVAKWGGHHKEVLLHLADGRFDAIGWRGERVPPTLLGQVREVVSDGMSEATGAALFWYLRNAFFHALGLDADPRVRLVAYEQLVSDPARVFEEVAAHAGVRWDPSWATDVDARSVGRRDEPDVDPAVARLCDALAEALATA